MTTNPFDDPDATYLVSVHDEAQYSLWSAFADVPAGWRVVHPQDTRQVRLDYIEPLSRYALTKPLDAMNNQL